MGTYNVKEYDKSPKIKASFIINVQKTIKRR